MLLRRSHTYTHSLRVIRFVMHYIDNVKFLERRMVEFVMHNVYIYKSIFILGGATATCMYCFKSCLCVLCVWNWIHGWEIGIVMRDDDFQHKNKQTLNTLMSFGQYFSYQFFHMCTIESHTNCTTVAKIYENTSRRTIEKLQFRTRRKPKTYNG